MLLRGLEGLEYGGGYGYCNWGGPFEWGGWFFGWMMPLLLWGAVIVVFIMLLRLLIKKNKTQNGDNTLEIVRRRYAAGEIDLEEFNELTANLS